MSTIAGQIPYSSTIYRWLCLNARPLTTLVEPSRRYERAYLAWETVRLVRNPFFKIGTGFEGYFVGICHSPEEMTDRLLEIGRWMLASNDRQYRHQYTFKTRLMRTLRDQLDDSCAIGVWAAALGAMLGKLRCNVYYNDAPYRFQNETYWAVNRLPRIHYQLTEHGIQQEFILPQFKDNGIPKQTFDPALLKPADYDAGLVVSKIGAVGHPLVRAYLRSANIY